MYRNIPSSEATGSTVSELYSAENLTEYNRRLLAETQLLADWFRHNAFSRSEMEVGFELEFFLVDKKMEIVPNNLKFIKSLGYNFLVPEVGLGSLEINSDHYFLHKNALSMFQSGLESLWNLCKLQADNQELHLLSTGIYPLAKKQYLSDDFITPMNRYVNLCHYVNRLCSFGKIPICLNGVEQVSMDLNSWASAGMLSAFQVHLRIDQTEVVRYYNAAMLLAAPLIAVSCNSPFFMRKQIWQETRIPFYEQLTASSINHAEKGVSLTTLGSGFLTSSLYQLYEANFLKYPRVLPIVNRDKSPDEMYHLRLQNSTVYRWVRPVIDFDAKHQPHLRLEFRPLPSGPSIIDMIANTAFYVGLVRYFAKEYADIHERIDFSIVKENFYRAARYGLNAELEWFNGVKASTRQLVLDTLLPLAAKGLASFALDQEDINYYLSIIESRANKGITGSQWQIQYQQRHQCSCRDMLAQYCYLQTTGKPVHEWPI